MVENESEQIIDISSMLIDCFFEFLMEGELADQAYQAKFASKDSFDKTKSFQEQGYSFCIDRDLPSSITIEINKLIMAKVNAFLVRTDVEILIDKLSYFDENVSKNSFDRVFPAPGKGPKEDIYEANQKWFELIWQSTFQYISWYEKTAQYTQKMNGQAIELAKKMVNEINQSIYGDHNKKDDKGLVGKTESLKSEMSTISDEVVRIRESIRGSESGQGENKKGGLVGEIDRLKSDTNNIKDDIQKNTVSVLGIFAAIVLAFSGTFSFTTSTLQGINSVSVYRLIGVIALLGIISFDLIAFLLVSVQKICQNTESANSSFEKPHFLFWVINAILIIALVFSFFAWKNDWLTKDLPDDETTPPCPSSSISELSSIEMRTGTEKVASYRLIIQK